MATVTSAPPTRQAAPPAKRPRKGPITWVREHIIAIVAALVFVYMLLPNVDRHPVLVQQAGRPVQLRVGAASPSTPGCTRARLPACAPRWG